MNGRVLAMGKSRRVLGKLTAALTEAGFDTRWTDDIAGASQRFPPSGVDLVAFGRGVGDAGVLDSATSGDGELTIDVRDDCDLQVTLYRLDRLYRTHRDVLLSERVPRGRRSIPLGTRPARRGATFAVVRVNAAEVTVIEL
jgi:hypothetical protein